MSETNGEWGFPTIHNGMIVDVDFDPGFAKPVMGLIIKAKKRSAAVLTFPDMRQHLITDCRHGDDPRIKENPKWASEDIRCRGLFRLNAAEFERVDTREKLQKLLGIVEMQAAQIAELQEQLESIAPDENRPKRGRKLKPVEA